MKARTEVVLASEIYERVVWRIFEIRNPDAMPEYRKRLALWKRRRGKREEIRRPKRGPFGVDIGETHVGFVVHAYGGEMFVPRPEKPRPPAYVHVGYERSSGIATHAQSLGLLAGAAFNRDIRDERVNEYAEAMAAGEWRDLLSDPLAITEDGHVVNGQHRIAAACSVNWDDVANDPQFLVVWGADPGEALLADGSRRTARDEKVIARKLIPK